MFCITMRNIINKVNYVKKYIKYYFVIVKIIQLINY